MDLTEGVGVVLLLVPVAGDVSAPQQFKISSYMGGILDVRFSELFQFAVDARRRGANPRSKIQDPESQR